MVGLKPTFSLFLWKFRYMKGVVNLTVIANVKQCLSTIKGIEAQLSTLALNSQDENAQKTFHEMMEVINEVKKDLQVRVNDILLEEPQYKP